MYACHELSGTNYACYSEILDLEEVNKNEKE